MVYKNQGCQVIRPDSVNLLDLNDYNISGDLAEMFNMDAPQTVVGCYAF